MNRLIYTRYVLIAGLAYATNGCYTPKPVVRLEPVAENTRWYFGKEYANTLQNGVSVAVAFEKVEQGRIILDVEVSNFTNREILVDPARFFYQACAILPEDGTGSRSKFWPSIWPSTPNRNSWKLTKRWPARKRSFATTVHF
ncbi:MAG: hypothetical protein HC880_05870 [Bacteroidia bacterium]|nr:hypothetical protein [Bacteroidia bacterium]